MRDGGKLSAELAVPPVQVKYSLHWHSSLAVMIDSTRAEADCDYSLNCHSHRLCRTTPIRSDEANCNSLRQG